MKKRKRVKHPKSLIFLPFSAFAFHNDEKERKTGKEERTSSTSLHIAALPSILCSLRRIAVRNKHFFTQDELAKVGIAPDEEDEPYYEEPIDMTEHEASDQS